MRPPGVPISRREVFVLVLLAAFAGCLVSETLGRAAAQLFPFPLSTGIAFLLFVGHLAVMIPVELLLARRYGSQGGRKPNRAFRASRARTWPLSWMYGSVAAQVWVAALGLGMATRHSGLAWPSLCLLGLASWRLLLVRVSSERDGRPHTPRLQTSTGRPRPIPRREIVLNFVADVPLVAISALLWFATHQGIWLVCGALFLSYSFLVRAGQYEDDRGPYAYAATLGSLVASAVLIWPVSTYLEPEWDGLPIWVPPLSLGVGYFIFRQAVRRRIPLRRRSLEIVCLVTVTAFFVWTGLFDRPVELSQDVLIHAQEMLPAIWLAMLAAFILPLGFYVLLMQLGEEMQWLLRRQPGSSANNPFGRTRTRP